MKQVLLSHSTFCEGMNKKDQDDNGYKSVMMIKWGIGLPYEMGVGLKLPR